MPDERTAGQREADTMLADAIQRVASEYEMMGDGWAVGDWVVAVEFVPFAEGLSGRERFGHITPVPTIPTHRILGLLTITDDNVRMGTEEL